MASRRRIDWEVILRPDAPKPQWTSNAAPSDLAWLLSCFDELFLIEESDAMLKRAVELALNPVGLVRAGLYLFDAARDLMLGTWGTDLNRNVVDEHHAMFDSGENNRRVFDRAISGEAHWTVVHDCPLIDQSNGETRIIGQGWVVCTPIRSARGPIGMLYNDPGLTGAALDPVKQARASVLCSVVGGLLDASRHSSRGSLVPTTSPQHPLVVKVVRMLTKDPSLGGKHMASTLNVSLSHLVRLFNAEMGLSLVDYRNRLRLERFLVLVDSSGTNLLEAALTAGFGSYAQFHRVFRNAYGKTPREYLVSRR